MTNLSNNLVRYFDFFFWNLEVRGYLIRRPNYPSRISILPINFLQSTITYKIFSLARIPKPVQSRLSTAPLDDRLREKYRHRLKKKMVTLSRAISMQNHPPLATIWKRFCMYKSKITHPHDRRIALRIFVFYFYSFVTSGVRPRVHVC